MSTKFIFSFCIICLSGLVPISASENDYSSHLQDLRKTASQFNSFRRSIVASIRLTTHNVEMVQIYGQYREMKTLLHVFIQQSNQFDAVLAKKRNYTVHNLPSKESDPCCWESIAIVYTRLRNLAREIAYSNQMEDSLSRSPQWWSDLQSQCKQLDKKLEYFQLFAQGKFG